MYCPKCAAQNLDDAKFCRACGTDISLVPQAVAGQLAERLAGTEAGGICERNAPPSMERAIKSLFMGVAFMFVATLIFVFAKGGQGWWFWMLIPAFALLGDAVASYFRVREARQRLAPHVHAPAVSSLPPPRAAALPPRDTGEMSAPPPSVTEATTRHLGVPVERRPKDV